jgi:hypothetical protein
LSPDNNHKFVNHLIISIKQACGEHIYAAHRSGDYSALGVGSGDGLIRGPLLDRMEFRRVKASNAKTLVCRLEK